MMSFLFLISQLLLANPCTTSIANIYKAGTYDYLVTTPVKEAERDRLVDALVATSTPVIIQHFTQQNPGSFIQQIEGLVVTINLNPAGQRMFNFLESRSHKFHNDLLVSGIRLIQFDKDLFGGNSSPAPAPQKDFEVTIDLVIVDDIKIALSFFKNNHLDTKHEITLPQTDGENTFVYVKKDNLNLYKIFIDKENFITKIVFSDSNHFTQFKKYLGDGLFNRNYKLSE